jgi:hypothetical protein
VLYRSPQRVKIVLIEPRADLTLFAYVFRISTGRTIVQILARTPTVGITLHVVAMPIAVMVISVLVLDFKLAREFALIS